MEAAVYDSAIISPIPISDVEESTPTFVAWPPTETVDHTSKDSSGKGNEKNVVELLRHLQVQEAKYGYHLSASDCANVSQAWRTKMCGWCFDVVDHLEYEREIVSIAFNYFDRTVANLVANANATNTTKPCTNFPTSKQNLQLLALTCFYVSIKLHGKISGKREMLSVAEIIEISQAPVSAGAFAAMELRVLDGLKWRTNPPTCKHFIECLLRLCPKWETGNSSTRMTVLGEIYNVSLYFSEHSVMMTPTFSFSHKVSVIGYVSILCAMEVLQTSFPLPRDVCDELLDKIAEATGLRPQMEEILQAYQAVKDLCPSIFEGRNFLQNDDTNYARPRGFSYRPISH